VQAYLEAIFQLGAKPGSELVSVILFGSAATGGFSTQVSDVDLILVLRDDAIQKDRRRWLDEVARLEGQHGCRDARARPRRALEEFVERVTANVRSFFVCRRGDLLSGDVSRILEIRPAQALFVDRAVLPSIVASAVTVWGEELLPHIPLLPIRRLDVFKAFQGLFGQVLLSVAVFPVLPDATKYAMGALKRSVHSCYFCYHARAAPLEEEVDFFQGRLGHSRALAQLVALRREYRQSFAFVVRCIPAVAGLHLRTAKDNRFPRETRPARTGMNA
jgi:hypothetical protein